MNESAKPSTREHIVEHADRLFYENGFEHTSFADIAAAVGISRGNFYHHFKTKDEILEAVIDRRMTGTSAMLERWNEASCARDRVHAFICMLSDNQLDIARYGCPVGSLCTELAKLGHAGQPMANRLFLLFVDWLSLQFRHAGLTRAKARKAAMHLMGRSQGVAVMASTLNDTAFIRSEVRELTHWLDSMLKASNEPNHQEKEGIA